MEIGDRVYITKDIQGFRGGLRGTIDNITTSVITGLTTYTIYFKSFDKEIVVTLDDFAPYNNPHTGTLFSEGKLTQDFE